ncbi:MAG: hypothetical protein LLF92_09480 [Planctomycetaceae bacterium]|nr:hypothetical protein [Planctomycetaceae bacterium]
MKAVIILLGCCIFASNLCLAAEPNGILKIEGKYVKHLSLYGNGKEVFNEPNKIINLPVGTYYISEIKLEGDYVCHPYNLSSKELHIKEGQTTVLGMGAPLNQNVNILRRGNSLVLNYKLQGIGGETYFPEVRGNPPKCTVYAGDEEIANCNFKYG